MITGHYQVQLIESETVAEKDQDWFSIFFAQFGLLKIRKVEFPSDKFASDETGSGALRGGPD